MLDRRRITLLCAGFAFATLPAQGVWAERGGVRTLAGNGLAGNRDGPAGSAEFVFPTGLAYDQSDGSVYVADSAGQRIRRIARDGAVSTVAGAGQFAPPAFAVAGGYRDGASLQAQFNYPFALALGADRAIYVADSRNHCIRRIAAGRVTTYAGSPRAAGARDGGLREATFGEPRGLAFDSDGTLYVADYGNGIRRISTAGVVSTLNIPSDFAKTVSSVSVWPRDDHALYAVGKLGLLRYNTRIQQVDGAQPVSDQQRIGAFGVVALSNVLAVVSSPRYDGIYLHDGRDRPWEPIAGQVLHDPAEAGGFGDGQRAGALFFAPLGIALDGSGNILVADAGNRRIRLVPGVDPTYPMGYPISRDPTVYRIAFVSNSFAFANTFWDDSIEARIARRLDADARGVGLRKPVMVEAISFPDIDLEAGAEYIREELAAGNVDLVVYSLNAFFFRESAHGNAPYFLPPVFPPESIAHWQAILRRLRATLAATHTQLVLADQPFGFELGPAEDPFINDDASLFWYAKYPQTVRVPGFGYEVNRNIEAVLDSVGIPHLGTYERFLERERSAHLPLYPSGNFHFSPVGNAFYADLIVDYLEKSKPWNAARAPVR